MKSHEEWNKTAQSFFASKNKMKYKIAAYDGSAHDKEDSYGIDYPEVEPCECWVSTNGAAFNVNKPNNQAGSMYLLLEIENAEYKRVVEYRHVKKQIEECLKILKTFKTRLAGLSHHAWKKTAQNLIPELTKEAQKGSFFSQEAPVSQAVLFHDKVLCGFTANVL